MATQQIALVTENGAIATLTLELTAPDLPDPGPPPVATLTVVPPVLDLLTAQTAQLVAVARDAAGNVLTDRTISWSSSSPEDATVDSTGLVTGRSAGAALVTAVCEGQTVSAQVTVTEEIPIPPPTAGRIFASDFPVLGTSLAAKSDGGKWRVALSQDQFNVGEVVDGAPLGFPCNVVRVTPKATQSALRLIQDGLGPLPENSERFYRVLFQIDHPSIGDNNNHPIETNNLQGAIAWALRSNVISNTVWRPQMRITGDQVFEGPDLSHHVGYVIEWCLSRLTGLALHLHMRVSDLNGVRIAGDENFRSLGGRVPAGTTLAANPTLQFPSTDGLGSISIGLNGISNTDWHPQMLFGYQGAVMIRSDRWAGPYVKGEAAE